MKKTITIIIVIAIILLGIGLYFYMNNNTNKANNYEAKRTATNTNTSQENGNGNNTSETNQSQSEQPSPPPVPSQTPTESEEIASFSTKIYTKDSSRQNNITITCSALNDTDILNGETFSFCNTVGRSSPSKGYTKADIFTDGKKTKGYGGRKLSS